MTSPANLGAVEVDVELNVEQVGPRLRRAVRRPAERVGEQLERSWARSGQQAGRSYAREFASSASNMRVELTGTLQQSMNTAIGRSTDGARPRWERAGRRSADAYNTGFKSEFMRGVMMPRLGKSFETPEGGFGRLAGGMTTAVAAGTALMAVLSPLTVGVLGLGAAVGQAVGTISLAPAALATLTGTIATLVVGFQGMGDAFSAAMDDDPKKLAAAMEDLAPSAKKVVTEFQKLRPQLTAIREAVQQNLFAGLDDDLARMGDELLPALERGMGNLATGMRDQFKAIMEGLTDSGNVKDFESILNNMGTGASNAAPGMRALVDALTDLNAVGSEFLPGFGDSFSVVTEKFADFIEKSRETGELEEFMQDSIDAAKQLGRTVRDTGVGIWNVFSRAASDAGGGFADRLEEASASFREWTESTAGQESMDTFFNAIGDAAEAATPALLAMGDVIGTDIVPALSEMVQELGPSVESFVRGIGDAIDRASPGLTQLSAGFGAILDAVEPLLPAIGDMVDLFSGTFGSALEGIAEVLGGMATAFGDVNDALDGVPAKIIAAAGGLALLARTLRRIRLKRSLAKSTEGIGDTIAGGIDRESKKAEGRAEKSGRRIGNKLKGGMRSSLATGGKIGIGAGLAGVGTALVDGASEEIKSGEEQLGNVLGGALKGAALFAGPWGIGAFLGNELLRGLTDVDVIGSIGDFLSRAFTGIKESVGNFFEHGFSNEGLGMVDDIANLAGGLFGGDDTVDVSPMNKLKEELDAIAWKSKETAASLSKLLTDVAEGEPGAVQRLRDRLDEAGVKSKEARNALEGLITSAQNGDPSGIYRIRDALDATAVSARESREFLNGFLDGVLNGGKLPGEVGPLFNFDDLAEGAAKAKPPVDELNESLGELDQKGKEAGGSTGFLDGYLNDVTGASYEAQYGIGSLNNALLEYNSSTSSAAQNQLSLQSMLGLTAGVFGNSMSMMVQAALLGWSSIQSSTTSGMSMFSSRVQSGMARSHAFFSSGLNRMNSANRSAWGGMRDSTGAGINNVVSLVAGLASRIIASVSGMHGPLFSAGVNAMSGLASGIFAGGGQAVAAARTIANRVIAESRSVMREASPSRVMREIGVHAGEGLALGLMDTRQMVARASSEMTRSAITPAQLGLPRLTGPAGAATRPQVSHNRSVTNHWTVNTRATDPRAIAAALRARYDNAASGVV